MKEKVVFSFPDTEISAQEKAVDAVLRASGLMGRMSKHRPGRPRPEPDWVSRDYALVIPCERIGCPVNRDGHCSMPSAVKIGPSGLCLTGQALIDKPVKRCAPVCRWCGGRIEQTAPGKWQHVGEKLSHPAEPRR